MSKSKKNKSINETTTEEVVNTEDTVESTETAVATEESTEEQTDNTEKATSNETAETPTTTEETVTTETITEKNDTSSESIPTETVTETPVDTEETTTEQASIEIVEEKKETTTKEPEAEITLATVLSVRFCSLFSNKRLATRRNMPLYNIIYTHIHNRASYIGLCNGEKYDKVVKYIQNNSITIESTKLSDKLKEQIIRKLKQDTDYAKIKWGNVDKQ